jgi:hypothetical protein
VIYSKSDDKYCRIGLILLLKSSLTPPVSLEQLTLSTPFELIDAIILA